MSGILAVATVHYEGYVYLNPEGETVSNADVHRTALMFTKKSIKATQRTNPLFARGFPSSLQMAVSSEGFRVSKMAGDLAVILDVSATRMSYVMAIHAKVFVCLKRGEKKYACHSFRMESKEMASSLSTTLGNVSRKAVRDTKPPTGTLPRRKANTLSSDMEFLTDHLSEMGIYDVRGDETEEYSIAMPEPRARVATMGARRPPPVAAPRPRRMTEVGKARSSNLGTLRPKDRSATLNRGSLRRSRSFDNIDEDKDDDTKEEPIYETSFDATNRPESLAVAPWFHGPISRQDAIQKLGRRTAGSFLIRMAQTHTGLSLSLVALAGQIRHFKLENKGDKFHINGHKQEFGSVSGLVLHYSHHPITVEGDKLENVVPR